MSGRPIVITRAGLVTSVGLTAPAACAAIRAGVTNHSTTRFVDSAGEWLLAAQVPLETPWRGRERLVQMLRLAVQDCIGPDGPPEPKPLPLLLCVSDRQRPGRMDGIDELVSSELAARLGLKFHPEYSATMAHGKVGVTVALDRARALLYDCGVEHVLIGAVDSLLTGPTLSAFETQGRLLTARNSNGFVPGEAAGAVLVSRDSVPGALICLGLGFAEERATIASDEPLRGEGLAAAIKKGLADADCQMHDLDFRIADISGEQYYFKEAALALSRTLRRRKETFDLWHPADSIGETGAAAGAVALAVTLAAGRKAYADGPSVLFHASNDGGQRAAAVLHMREAA